MADVKIFERSNFKAYAIATFIYLIAALIVLWPIPQNIMTVTFGSPDPRQTFWNIWWAGHALFSLHTQIYNTNLLYYPMGTNLVLMTLSPLAGILTFPIQSLGLVFTYNLLTILGFMLSGIFMFMLSYYLTGNRYAAFIAGLIFAFSPMHIAQSTVHLDWASIEFIPLFVLFFLLELKERKIKYAVIAAIAFVCASFVGDTEQGIMIGVFVLLFAYAYINSNRKEYKKVLYGILLIAALSVIFSLPFLIPIVKTLLSSNALGIANQGAQNSLADNVFFSDDVLAFFLPSYLNRLYDSNTSYAPNPILANNIQNVSFSGYKVYSWGGVERVSYVGYTVLLLCLLAIFLEKNKDRIKTVRMWGILTVVFALLAMGPIIVFGSFFTFIPGLYFFYKLIPIFNLIREPGRFDVFVTLGLGIMAGFGSVRLFAYVREKKLKRPKHAEIYITFLLSLLIMLEYYGIPPLNPASLVSYSIPKSYYELGAIPCNCAAIALPYSESNVSYAMYFQTVFQKPIIGGYISRYTNAELLSLSQNPLVSQDYYSMENGTPIFYSPIKENYTKLDLLLIENDSVGFVVLMMQTVNSSVGSNMERYLANIFGKPLLQENSTDIFSTSNALNTSWNNSVLAYPDGGWQISSSICQNSPCSSQYASLWWGNSTRNITIFAPHEANATMELQAASNTLMPVAIYLNGKTVAALNLSYNVSNYTISLQLENGANYLEFYSQVGQNQSEYNSFGIRNITFNDKG